MPALAEEASRRAPEIERLRKLPQDFADRLRQAGVFRLLVPEDLGGLGGTLEEWWRMARAFSEADGSTGWVTAQGSMYGAVAAAKHPANAVREMFADPCAHLTGSGVGSGQATSVDGGYRVSGHWSFASGCTLSSHFSGLAKVEGDPDPLGRMFFMPMNAATITESWDASGLAGSGSHEVSFDDVFVTADYMNLPFDHVAFADGPIATWAYGHWWDTFVAAAVETGLARRALSETWKIARTSPLSPLPGSAARTTDSAVLRTLQYAEGILGAQDAAVERAIQRTWQKACDGTFDREDTIAVETATVTAVQEAKRVIDMVVEVAGTKGLMNGNVLSRIIRDAQAMTVHAVGRKARFELIARVAEGDERIAPFL